MGKLRVVVADSDMEYVQGLSDYMGSFHSYKFEVRTFTSIDYLIEFLAKKDNKYDILLLSTEFYLRESSFKELEKSALLSPGNIIQDFGLPVVDKYQHAERIVGCIAGILAETREGRAPVPGGRLAKTVAVYSACGGIGKTSVALGCSMQCSKRGLKVFYLNLEMLNSACFLTYDKRISLSQILFHAKEKNNNLALKIEASKCIDSKYGIHYFPMVDSPLDIEDMSWEELGFLLETIKTMGLYDFIFIDMTSCFNRINARLLEECSNTIFLYAQDRNSGIRQEKVLQLLAELCKKGYESISDKSIFVVNKYKYQCPVEYADPCKGGKPIVKIPFLENLEGGIEGCLAQRDFEDEINQILEQLL